MRLPVVIIPCSAACGSCSRHNPVPFVRMEVEQGQEAQVDFWARGAWVLVNGKRKRPHLFGSSFPFPQRHYSEVVWQQTTELPSGVWKMRFVTSAKLPRTR